jgi:predicted ATPase
VDEQVATALAANPNAMIFLAINLRLPPVWDQTHGDDLVRIATDSGTLVWEEGIGNRVGSLASEAWYRDQEIELRPINVLIGANASGKSNLIEVIGLLQALPRDLREAFEGAGGAPEWFWKGPHGADLAEIVAAVEYPINSSWLRYRLVLKGWSQGYSVAEESLDEVVPSDAGEPDERAHYRFTGTEATIWDWHDQVDDAEPEWVGRPVDMATFSRDQSALSQFQTQEAWSDLTILAVAMGQMRRYTEWNLGRGTEPRLPHPAAGEADFLSQDGSNLALVLNHLEHSSDAGHVVTERLKAVCEGVDGMSTRVHEGQVQLFLHERGLRRPIPATRLSDGTMRYLCLLAILCHPSPPPLVCIEEPELGLHPDIVSNVLPELLLEASQRTQLIVTTHSDILVSGLSEHPAAVLVCERDDDGTHFTRLDPDRLKDWLERYSLGTLWTMGEIGGNRW